MKFLSRALPHSENISTGDGLRRVARKKNLVGRYIRGVLSKGGLVPYWGPAFFWLADFFERLNGDENVIFDGAPRRVEEARLLDDFMRDIGRKMPLAIYIRLNPAAARARLINRGRNDDNPRAILARFAFFRRHVRPVIRYYKNRGRLIAVNGEQPVRDVWRDIKIALNLK